MQTTEVYLSLIANVIIDVIKQYSAKNENIHFKESDCIGYKGIRFSTSKLDSIFPPVNKQIGYFKNGHFAYYEFRIIAGEIEFNLKVSKLDLKPEYSLLLRKLNYIIETNDLVTLYNEKIIDTANTSTAIKRKILSFLKNKLDKIEEDAFTYQEDNDELKEGSLYESLDIKYERNKEAREKCLAYYGTKCMICGYDSKKIFGENTKPIIEVHHIVPLSEIKEEYIVDPIKDLIPVCPNCHAFIHSKENGTYSIEEVKNMIKKNVR